MPTTSVSRIVAASQKDVWAVLSDVENARRWNPAWQRVQITSSQRHGQGTTFRAHTEDGQDFEFEITDWAPPEFISFSPIHDEDEALYPITLESHSFVLRPVDEHDGEAADTTRVELIANASVHGLRGWIWGLFFWRGHQTHGLEAALDSLQDIFEPPEGEEPDPDTVQD
jgi:uncharacterized protein YndB with AHSA1/START domain